MAPAAKTRPFPFPVSQPADPRGRTVATMCYIQHKIVQPTPRGNNLLKVLQRLRETLVEAGCFEVLLSTARQFLAGSEQSAPVIVTHLQITEHLGFVMCM